MDGEQGAESRPLYTTGSMQQESYVQGGCWVRGGRKAEVQ